MAITPSTSAKARLGRMTAATVDPKMDDSALSDALTLYATLDANGALPGAVSWSETYDWNGAAAEVWGWKEAAASAWVSTNADGTQLSLSQIVANCQAQKLYYQSQRAWGTIGVIGVAE